MEKDDEFYNNLITLLKIFKNRPYHLAKYLIDNSALNDDFKSRLLKSDSIKELQKQIESEGMNLPAIQFNDIGKMQEYFNSLSQISEKEDIKKLTKELNNKMSELLKTEKYEEAANLRDYMISKNIKRNNNF